jgi:MurNAc alpha-1-phosphate uridylyltransferase
MKAMILAAGRGERMRPLTDNTPKPLLWAGKHRLIEYHLFNLAKAGFKNVVINVAWLGQQIIDTLGDGERYGLHIEYSNEGEHALETGGGIFKALPLLGSQPFLVINGDIWTDYPYEQLKNHKLAGAAHLVLVDNPEHNSDGDFYYSNGQLIESGAKKYTFSGIGIYSTSFFEHETGGAFPLAPMIRDYLKKGMITGELYHGTWKDIGTIERLAEIEKKQAE